MIKKWLFPQRAKNETSAPTSSARLHEQLLEAGLTEEAIEWADHHRHLLSTRLLSTLVAHGRLDEPTAVAVLGRHVGLPGICLRRSVVDLSLDVPDSLVQKLRFLPVQAHPEGFLVLAWADAPAETVLQEVELEVGRSVRAHIALHFDLERAIHAFCKLRTECVDAAYMLGEEVEAEGLQDPATRVMPVVPRVDDVPSLRPEQPGRGSVGPRVLVAMPDDETREGLAQHLRERGLDVTTAADGPAALRAVLTEEPALVILHAKLPERSGVEIIRRLASGERYQKLPKLLVVPDALPEGRAGLDGIHNVTLVPAEELTLSLESTLAGLQNDGVTDAQGRLAGNGAASKARACLWRGLALCEEGNVEGAMDLMREALRIDPLLPAAHRELARLCQAQDAVYEAMDRYSMALDLGETALEDVTALAELLQQQGLLSGAARAWQRAATLVADPEAASELRAHAAQLAPGVEAATTIR